MANEWWAGEGRRRGSGFPRAFGWVAALSIVAPIVASAPALAAENDLVGTIIDSEGNGMIGQIIRVENCDNPEYYVEIESGTGGAWGADSDELELSVGDPVCITITSPRAACGGIPPTNVDVDTTIVIGGFQPYDSTTIEIPDESGGGGWGSTLELGQVTTDIDSSGAADKTDRLGWSQAVASSGSFGVSADFQYLDADADGPGTARQYDFELYADYIGYIDVNCVFQSDTQAALDSTSWGSGPVQYRACTTGFPACGISVDSGVQALSLPSLSSSQGQPGTAQYIVVEVSAKIVQHEATGCLVTYPTCLNSALAGPGDFTATRTYWVQP
jgi:hypothetical protein